MSVDDQATKTEEFFRNISLNQRVVYKGESKHICVDCDNPIPEPRRKAIAGCTRCTECEEDHQLLGSRYVKRRDDPPLKF